MTSTAYVPYHIRQFEPSDAEYTAVASLVSSVWSEYPITAGDLKRGDEFHRPDLLLRRLVAEVDGKIIGVCAFRESEGSYRPGKFIVGLSVCNDYKGRGIGTALYDHMIDYLSTRELTVLTTDTLEDQDAALRFLERRGFERVMRHPVSRLDVTNFNADPFAVKQQVVADRGIEVKSLAVLREVDNEWQRNCWNLSWTIDQDIPTADRLTRPTLERFSELFEHPNFAPEGWFVALDGRRWVGLHTVWPNKSTPLKYYTGVTGVFREYRRCGIATVLKLSGVEFVRLRGGQIIETNNEENNPMFTLNLTLGFKPGPAWIHLNKTF